MRLTCGSLGMWRFVAEPPIGSPITQLTTRKERRGMGGRRSNQLNYDPNSCADTADFRLRLRSICASIRHLKPATCNLVIADWAVQDSNLWQPACKAGALPLS